MLMESQKPNNNSQIQSKCPIRTAFANTLREAILDRGWTQAELANRAAKHTPNGEFGRQCVSVYLKGKSLPRPEHLTALSRALNMKPTDLLPTRGAPTLEHPNPPLDVRDLGQNKAWVRVNQECDWDIALQIMALLKTKSSVAS